MASDTGVVIRVQGITRERCLRMTYEDGGATFEFLATRYESIDPPLGDIPMFSRWLVALSLLSVESLERFASIHGEANEDARKRIRKNISEALLTWPITPATPAGAETVSFEYERSD